MFLQELSLISALVAFLTGLIVWKSLPLAFKLFFFEIMLSISVEVIGLITSATGVNNTYVYNIYFFVDINIIGAACIILLDSPILKKVTFINLAVFAIIWMISIFLSGWQVLANKAFLFGSAALSFSYLVLLVNSIRDAGQRKITLLSIGVILFYSCNIPFFGMLNYLNKHSPKIAYDLYTINIVLSILQYLLVSYSFFLCARKKNVALVNYDR